MHAMQYELTLPADYDMAVIRARVPGSGICWTTGTGSASRRT